MVIDFEIPGTGYSTLKYPARHLGYSKPLNLNKTGTEANMVEPNICRKPVPMK
jgi:hypothetical protein